MVTKEVSCSEGILPVHICSNTSVAQHSCIIFLLCVLLISITSITQREQEFLIQLGISRCPWSGHPVIIRTKICYKNGLQISSRIGRLPVTTKKPLGTEQQCVNPCSLAQHGTVSRWHGGGSQYIVVACSLSEGRSVSCFHCIIAYLRQKDGKNLRPVL